MKHINIYVGCSVILPFLTPMTRFGRFGLIVLNDVRSLQQRTCPCLFLPLALCKQ